MALPSFHIGPLKIAKAIVQQGMAIMVSLADIAVPVVNCGGVGTIAGSAMSPSALRKELQKAKNEIDPKTGGKLAVNLMKALKKRKFYNLVDVCIEEGVDILFVGAGLVDRELVEYCKGNIELVPIVSQTSILDVIFMKRMKGYKPNALVVETGPAGGHLGTKQPESEEAGWRPMLIDFKTKLHEMGWDDVTVIITGGLLTAEDVQEAYSLGADAVGMGYRFAMTLDSRPRLAKWQDVFLTKTGPAIVTGGDFGPGSPAGFPSRMFVTPLVAKLLWDGVVHFGEPKCRYDCLERCVYRDGKPAKGILPFTKSFCINGALRIALAGDPMGLYFPSGRFREVKYPVWIGEYIDYLDGEREMPEQQLAA